MSARSRGVESILTIGRNATAQQHEKLQEIVPKDISDLSAIEGRLSGRIVTSR